MTARRSISTEDNMIWRSAGSLGGEVPKAGGGLFRTPTGRLNGRQLCCGVMLRHVSWLPYVAMSSVHADGFPEEAKQVSGCTIAGLLVGKC